MDFILHLFYFWRELICENAHAQNRAFCEGLCAPSLQLCSIVGGAKFDTLEHPRGIGQRAAQAALAQAPEQFILGADCTVPGETPWDNVKTAIDTAHAYKRK